MDYAAELARLLEEQGDHLLRLCTLYLQGDVHLAEDAVQETFLRAWRNAGWFRGESSVYTWLVRIAMNVCKSWLRSPWKKRRVSAAALEGLSVPAGPPDMDDTLPKAIMALSRPYREVILLYYYEELKAREIAALLGVSVSTVTARLSRARQQLRERLKEWYYEPEA